MKKTLTGLSKPPGVWCAGEFPPRNRRRIAVHWARYDRWFYAVVEDTDKGHSWTTIEYVDGERAMHDLRGGSGTRWLIEGEVREGKSKKGKGSGIGNGRRKRKPCRLLSPAEMVKRELEADEERVREKVKLRAEDVKMMNEVESRAEAGLVKGVKEAESMAKDESVGKWEFLVKGECWGHGQGGEEKEIVADVKKGKASTVGAVEPGAMDLSKPDEGGNDSEVEFVCATPPPPWRRLSSPAIVSLLDDSDETTDGGAASPYSRSTTGGSAPVRLRPHPEQGGRELAHVVAPPPPGYVPRGQESWAKGPKLE